MDNQSWDRVAQRNNIAKENKNNTIYFVSMLKPEPFADAILLGANIEDSLLFHWFQQQGVRFQLQEEIRSKLRDSPPALGERLSISYFLPRRNFSKHAAKKESLGGGTVIDRMDALALEEFAGEPFLYVSNNDQSSEILRNAPNGKQIGVVSNGLNNLQANRNIYFSAALNRQPKHFEMLKGLGLTPALVHQATAHEATYQGIMRTSLRNPGSTDRVRVIVPDQPSAERLGYLLGCRDISQIGDVLPPPKRPLSQRDKSRRGRLARLKEATFAASNVPRNVPRSFINEDGIDSRTFASKAVERQANYCVVTFHKNPYVTEAKEGIELSGTIQDFVSFLKTAAITPVDDKEALFLFNATTFGQSKHEGGHRTQGNFVQSWCMPLDFDNGTLSPEAFEDIFWKKAKRGDRHSFIICNSYSRSPDKPNKFRVVLFYQRPVQSIEEHKAVYDYVLRRLEECGHTEDLRT